MGYLKKYGVKYGVECNKKYYEDKMSEILDREVNTNEDCIRQVDELMMLDAQYLLSNI